MAKSRRQDTRSESTRRDESQSLKAIVRALKKENAQLRKQLGKMTSFEEDYRNLLEDIREREPAEKGEGVCPECREPTRTTPGKITLISCTRCSWISRKR